MIALVPVTPEDTVEPGLGRATTVALVTVADGAVTGYQRVDVGWDVLHDEGTEGAHHARVVRFLREHDVDTVVAQRFGAGMARMLDSMGLRVVLDATGDARAAVLSAAG